MEHLRVDADELRRFAADLRAADRALPGELRKELRAVGQPVLSQIRQVASWSARIPAATTMQVSLSKRRTGIFFKVNQARAPHAKAYEGNGQPGRFRHPVFGNDRVWVSQGRRTFLFRTVLRAAPQAEQAVGRAVDTVARRAGFH